MSFTFTEHTANGTQVTFPFSFAGRDKGYIKASDIVVEQLFNAVWTPIANWSLSGTNQVTLLSAPAAGVKLRIRRVVDKEQPYAEFQRGVALDMNSLNNSFIHILEITQEILDGFFPDGYFIKQNVNYGGNRIVNLGDGVDAQDAVTKGQLDAVDKKHTDWNTAQDSDIASLKFGLTSGVAHRTIPWNGIATSGQKVFSPPFEFDDVLVFINGRLQHQLDGAFTVSDNKITFSEPLMAGDKVYTLLGSRIATTVSGLSLEWGKDIAEGTTSVDIGSSFKHMDVFLDGLFQPKATYTVAGNVVTFSESLPACRMTANIIT